MLNMTHKDKSQLQKVIISGGILRFFFLFLVVVVLKNNISPYIMADDIAYEELAREFMSSASSIFDIRQAAMIGVDGYLEVFWPYVMCFSAKLLSTEFAGRILNCLISTYCIYLVYELTLLVSERRRAALIAAKLFAFLPYPLIICCFPFKDIFLTMVVLFVFIMFVKFQKKIHIPVTHFLIAVPLLIAVSFTRGAVVELLGLIGAVFIISSLIKHKKILYACIAIVVALIGLYYMWDVIIESFITKIDTYNSEEYISMGFMGYLQINHLTDIWRLPATYFFAMIQPMSLSVFSPDWTNWGYLLRVLNLTLYPIALGNMIYAFSAKYNKLFWVTSFLMYAAVISLSLGIYRHYLFLFPFLAINYACNLSMDKPYNKILVPIGSALMILCIFIISL